MQQNFRNTDYFREFQEHWARWVTFARMVSRPCSFMIPPRLLLRFRALPQLAHHPFQQSPSEESDRYQNRDSQRIHSRRKSNGLLFYHVESGSSLFAFRESDVICPSMACFYMQKRIEQDPSATETCRISKTASVPASAARQQGDNDEELSVGQAVQFKNCQQSFVSCC